MSLKSTTWSAPGSYGTKRIRGEIFAGKDSEWLVMLFHGCCGTPYDLEPSFYDTAAPHLAEKYGFVTAFYESSRRVDKRQFFAEHSLTEGNYEVFLQEGFGGKTWEDEVHDAWQALHYVQEQAQPSKVALVGFSLGGLMATMMTAKTSVDALFCFGSALNFQIPPDKPILGVGTPVEEIQSVANRYTGSVHLYHGTADSTALCPDVEGLFRSYSQAEERQLTQWKGVDHRFHLRDGQPDERLWERIETEVGDFLTPREF